MSIKTRCQSNWNKITVLDENNVEIKHFELDELGKLKNKIKTQNQRRKIHEGRRAKKIQDLSKASIPKANDKESNQSHTFDLDVFNDQENSMFGIFQDFSEISNDSNNDFNMSDVYFENDTDILFNINTTNYDFIL